MNLTCICKSKKSENYLNNIENKERLFKMF